MPLNARFSRNRCYDFTVLPTEAGHGGADNTKKAIWLIGTLRYRASLCHGLTTLPRIADGFESTAFGWNRADCSGDHAAPIPARFACQNLARSHPLR